MNILITGCGSGLGQSLLEESIRRDHLVFPHYRNSSSHFSGDICDDGFSDKLSEYVREKNIDVFANIIMDAGFASPIRKPRGQDIFAACGQLKSETQKIRKSQANKFVPVHSF